MVATAIALGAAALTVVVLLALTVRTRRQVRRLTSEVHDLRTRFAAVASPGVAPPAAAEPPVAVITELAAPTVARDAEPPTSGRVVSVTLAGPLIKAAALCTGLRRALDEETRMRAGYAFRRELRLQRRQRRRASLTRPRRTQGWLP